MKPLPGSRWSITQQEPTMDEDMLISLTYRGVVGHRGIRISRESYRKTWTLSLANGVWTLTDHNGGEVHSFRQADLYSKLVLPGSLHGYPDLYFTGLGPQIHCFEPEREVLEALKPYVEQSERANAPQLARWHRLTGIGFLGLGVLGFAICVAALSWAFWGDADSALKLTVALTLIPSSVWGGGYFLATGVGDLRVAGRFAKMVAREPPDS